MDKRFPNLDFPIEQIEDELARDHDAFKDMLSASLTEMINQNPQLFTLKVNNIDRIEIHFELGRSSPNGVLLDYLLKLQQHIEEEMCNSLASQIGRPISVDEIRGVLTVSQSDYRVLCNIVERYKAQLVKSIRLGMLETINNSIPGTQQKRPNIEIGIVLKDLGGTRRILYVESQGKVHKDEVVKLPSVTLDTNVLMNGQERLKL